MKFVRKVTTSFLLGCGVTQEDINWYREKFWEREYDNYALICMLECYYDAKPFVAEKLLEVCRDDLVDEILFRRCLNLRKFLSNPDYNAFIRDMNSELLLTFLWLYTDESGKFAQALPEYIGQGECSTIDIAYMLTEAMYWVWSYGNTGIYYDYRKCKFLRSEYFAADARIEMTTEEIQDAELFHNEFLKYKNWYKKTSLNNRGIIITFERRMDQFKRLHERVGLLSKEQTRAVEIGLEYIEKAPEGMTYEKFYKQYHPERLVHTDRTYLSQNERLVSGAVKKKNAAAKKEATKRAANDLGKLNKLCAKGITMLEWVEQVDQDFWDLENLAQLMESTSKKYPMLYSIVQKWVNYSMINSFSLIEKEKAIICGKEVTPSIKREVLGYMKRKGYPEYYMLYTEILRKYMKDEIAL